MMERCRIELSESLRNHTGWGLTDVVNIDHFLLSKTQFRNSPDFSCRIFLHTHPSGALANGSAPSLSSSERLSS
jgi:hypothetical protein